MPQDDFCNQKHAFSSLHIQQQDSIQHGGFGDIHVDTVIHDTRHRIEAHCYEQKLNEHVMF